MVGAEVKNMAVLDPHQGQGSTGADTGGIATA
jgi:hypothetical protein